MLELYIIRHGLAGSSLKDKIEDNERPLEKKGKRIMKDIAKGLKKLKISFDLVLTSPLLRAKESAEIVNAYCGNTKKIKETELLSPGASFDHLIEFLNNLKDSSTVAIVGHEPFLSSFASYCLSKNNKSFINLKKSGIIKLEINEIIKPGDCKLLWLMEPKPLISILC